MVSTGAGIGALFLTTAVSGYLLATNVDSHGTIQIKSGLLLFAVSAAGPIVSAVVWRYQESSQGLLGIIFGSQDDAASALQAHMVGNKAEFLLSVLLIWRGVSWMALHPHGSRVGYPHWKRRVALVFFIPLFWKVVMLSHAAQTFVLQITKVEHSIYRLLGERLFPSKWSLFGFLLPAQ